MTAGPFLYSVDDAGNGREFGMNAPFGRWAPAVAALATALAACGGGGGGGAVVTVKACNGDDSCVAMAGGKCLSTGFPGSPNFCAYADVGCPSTFRWGLAAGYNLKGMCVSGDLGDMSPTPGDLGGSDALPDMSQILDNADLAMPEVADMAMAPPADQAMMPGADLAQPMGTAPTGAPCAKTLDCAGTKPVCILKDAQGHNWPGGYCVSQCNPQKNDLQSGINPACPGGGGTCLGTGTMGTCETACTGMNGMMPCQRQGYLCFQACEPMALSDCDPTMKGSCLNGTACIRVGSDDVGRCAPACDPFKQGCAQIMMADAACYASDDTGEGACSTVFGKNSDGQQCVYLNDCVAGLACYSPPNAMNQNQVLCRPYCGGPMNVACNNNKQCVDLSPNVKKAVIGVCGG